MSVATALDTFVSHYTLSADWLYTEHDSDWPSACEIGAPYAADGLTLTRWAPARRTPADDFAGLEAALELPLHQDIKAYYSRYWAASMEALAPDGPVSLIFLWNEEDIDRFVENMIGHALQQRRSKAPLTVFFATTTPDSEYFLSVHNETGEVLLELPGRKPQRTVAPDLAHFLEELSPNPPPPI